MKVIVILCMIGTIYSWNGWTIEKYPNPKYDLDQCGRKGVIGTAICDPDGIISPSYRDKVDAILENIL